MSDEARVRAVLEECAAYLNPRAGGDYSKIQLSTLLSDIEEGLKDASEMWEDAMSRRYNSGWNAAVEACAKTLCGECDAGNKPYLQDGQWLHARHFACDAASIRALSTAKAESAKAE